MDEKLKAAFEVIHKVCGDFMGNHKDHIVIQESLQIIRTAALPKPDRKEPEKIKVPRKARGKRKR